VKTSRLGRHTSDAKIENHQKNQKEGSQRLTHVNTIDKINPNVKQKHKRD
jgi:hypothetical protein